MFLCRQDTGGQQLIRQIHLPLPDLCAFAQVKRMRHQLKVGEDFVERRGDSARDDVVNRELLASVGSARDRRRPASATS